MEFDVVGEVEAELVEVETQATIEIADEDLGGMDAEVGGRRRGGWGASGHAGDYKTGEGTRKKITRRRRVRGEAQKKRKADPSLRSG